MGPSPASLKTVLPRGAAWASAWTRVAQPRIRATSAPRRRSRGLLWLCHMAPFFALFLKRIKYVKIKINSEKIYKIQKSISLKIELLLNSNFLHWLTNLFLFNIMLSKIKIQRRKWDGLKIIQINSLRILSFNHPIILFLKLPLLIIY